jgi:hypothetical protein
MGFGQADPQRIDPKRKVENSEGGLLARGVLATIILFATRHLALLMLSLS